MTAELWTGDFGNEYTKRQDLTIESRKNLFEKALNRVYGIRSVIEFGANVGDNLRALRELLPDATMTGVEPNKEAYEIMMDRVMAPAPGYWFCNSSIQDWVSEEQFDLVLTRGLLIHIPPSDLGKAYAAIYNASSRYILLAEYYSPNPVMIPYRGQDDQLWKRDFAGEMLHLYPRLKLIDCGFISRHDPQYPQDDVSWFLLSKK
ncbi:MAG: pseudaminic acid biosynthesis-associated methylase [Bellilinea sp.]